MSFFSSFFKQWVVPNLVISTITRHLVEPKKLILQDTKDCQYYNANATNFWVLTRVSYLRGCLWDSCETNYWSWQRIDLNHRFYEHLNLTGSSKEPQPSGG